MISSSSLSLHKTKIAHHSLQTISTQQLTPPVDIRQEGTAGWEEEREGRGLGLDTEAKNSKENRLGMKVLVEMINRKRTHAEGSSHG